MRRGYFVKNLIAFVGVVISICCLLVIMVSVLQLPEVTLRNKSTGPNRIIRTRKVSKDEAIGRFGEMMIEMLPEDLAFTVFVPSEKAFQRDLKLQLNDSLVAEKRNDTYAVVSRILGFSAVPHTLSSTTVSSSKEVFYDSLSGFTLYISKDLDGMLVVNRIRSEMVDLKRGEIIVHIMDGVIMDAEFEQAVQPDYTEED
ncbi:FASCICLIN DOMAIN PROTEIN [Salix purpurea]|uniref:FASCICLIN DOMAIN PROTEIN n=1 Tax=Salix purpurea TaxID=77065 RepID=A0A9Q0TUH4_SALPP|nr:FASCICLIN DOMAIN PROTEIN [Salix purpurea]